MVKLCFPNVLIFLYSVTYDTCISYIYREVCVCVRACVCVREKRYQTYFFLPEIYTGNKNFTKRQPDNTQAGFPLLKICVCFFLFGKNRSLTNKWALFVEIDYLPVYRRLHANLNLIKAFYVLKQAFIRQRTVCFAGKFKFNIMEKHVYCFKNMNMVLDTWTKF